jgi:hypothetical protein
MYREISSGFSPRRGTLRTIAMNAVLVMLLAGVFVWSAAGNAIDHMRTVIEKRS